MRRTGFLFHERYLWHDSGSAASVIPAGGMAQPGPHAESPERVGRIRALVEVSGLADRLVRLPARAASEEELGRFHTAEYIARVRELSDGEGGESGQFAHVGPSSCEIAALAAGGALAAVEAVVAGDVENAYALVRPPGHHAMPGEGIGGCIFANTTIAAMHARQALGLQRVAIVDWDAHHGNSQQHAFYEDPSVLTISLHQDGCFPPGSGTVDEIGAGEGLGSNINIPLPPGSGTGAYEAAFARVVLPALEEHQPQLIVLACGFDSCAWDGHARLMLHSRAYRELTGELVEAARRLCDGRLVVIHEGGYQPGYAPFCGVAVLEALSGIDSGVEDPLLSTFEGYGYQELQPHQEAVIAAAAERRARAA
ncbi:MAG: class II histone deacetylase [Solirubrobacteraceae bacterium]